MWSGDAKTEADVRTEALDRCVRRSQRGRGGVDSLQSGVSRNPLWRHDAPVLLTAPVGSAVSFQSSDGSVPVDVGYVLVPGLAHGTGPIGMAANALTDGRSRLESSFLRRATIEANIRPLLAHGDAPLVTACYRRSAERHLVATRRERVRPQSGSHHGQRADRRSRAAGSRILSMQAPTKGGPLYGEGQYWMGSTAAASFECSALCVCRRTGR